GGRLVGRRARDDYRGRAQHPSSVRLGRASRGNAGPSTGHARELIRPLSRIDVQLREARIVAALADAHAQRTREERSRVRERVELAVLAARIDARARDIANEALVDRATEPRRVELRRLDAREHGPPADRDEFREQIGRRLAPDRLDVLE